MIRFRILDGRAETNAASPTLAFTLRVDAPISPRIHSIALQAQVRIEPARRRHDPEEQCGMVDLFGEPSRWGRTQKPLLLADVSRVVSAFEGTSEVTLSVPCTYDLDVASAKYLHALRGGVVPLLFLFRGTVFAEGDRGLAVSMLPWDREASFDLPVTTWRDAMDAFFPGQGWLRLRRDVLDSLLAFKTERALTSWDDVMNALLTTRPPVTS